MAPIDITVRDISYFERPVWLRLPFRFGVTTLYRAPQGFLRVEIETSAGVGAVGWGAEMLAPKWFDKDLGKSDDDNFDDLRTAVRLAAPLYRGAGFKTAFELSMVVYADHRAAAAAAGLNGLVAGFGQALIDRAVADAVCRAQACGFDTALRRNVFGLRTLPVVADLEGFDWAAFLAAVPEPDSIHARHTVGMVDPLTEAAERVDDGLPETLAEVVSVYGPRYFKLKLGGDIAADMARLQEIAAILDTIPDAYQVTLDGNEQYGSVDALAAFLTAFAAEPSLRRLREATILLEQPLQRAVALSTPITALQTDIPVIIDESDEDFDSFPTAIGLGYRGVSSKLCKGLYKSLINRARCHARGGGLFMTGEDLTTQAGLGVQQDLALVQALGLTHVERNGHHYVDGMAGAGDDEKQAFSRAHPDLYSFVDGNLRLKIDRGRLAIRSLACTGFGSGALPSVDTMEPISLNG